jgi:phage-related protein
MTLPAWISTHKGDAVRSTFWLVKLGLATPLYLTDCDQPIVYDGHTFTPAPCTVDGLQNDSAAGAGNGGRLMLATGGTYWQPLLAEIAGGTRTFEVTVWEAWLDVTALPSAAPPANAVRLVAVTRVEAAEWDTEWLALTLGPAASPSLGRLPFREYGPSCTYRRFKGPQCGYSGAETTCDRTIEACTARSNATRFGGFEQINTLDEAVGVWNWQVGEVYYTGTVTFRLRGV